MALNGAAAGDPPGLATGVRWLARSSARAFLVIFLLAFAVGTAVLPFVPRSVIEPHTRWEVNAVAVSLATTGRFADPYALPSGPTAHMPPAFPALLALLYRIFGLTNTAGYVAYFIQVAAAAAMVAMLPWLSHRLGTGREAGLIGGLAGALVPRSLYEIECMAAVAMGLLVAWHVKQWRAPRRSLGGALLVGLGWGASFHITPSLLPVLVGCVLFDLWWNGDRQKWLSNALVALGVALACLPWTLRNYTTFGEFYVIRSDFGLELRMGNHDGAAADLDTLDRPGIRLLRHPRTHLGEAQLVQQLGEAEYMRRVRAETFDWIRRHPDRFLSLSAQRVFHFWFGSPSQGREMALGSALLTILASLGLRRAWPTLTVPGRAGFLIPLLTFPLVYYVVVFMPRYGMPLTGMLLVLAGVEVCYFTARR